MVIPAAVSVSRTTTHPDDTHTLSQGENRTSCTCLKLLIRGKRLYKHSALHEGNKTSALRMVRLASAPQAPLATPASPLPVFILPALMSRRKQLLSITCCRRRGSATWKSSGGRWREGGNTLRDDCSSCRLIITKDTGHV